MSLDGSLASYVSRCRAKYRGLAPCSHSEAVHITRSGCCVDDVGNVCDPIMHFAHLHDPNLRALTVCIARSLRPPCPIDNAWVFKTALQRGAQQIQPGLTSVLLRFGVDSSKGPIKRRYSI